MEVKYRTSLNHNYMVIQALEGKEESYELKMLTGNHIPAFLPVQSSLVNGKTFLNYEITGLLSLTLAYEKVGMTGEDIRSLIRALAEAIRNCEQYLLPPVDLLLNPACVYRKEDGTVLFPCLPGYGDPDEGSFRELESLAEFILKHLNHSDQEAVALGYEFYNCAGKNEVNLEEELEEVLKVQRKPGDTALDPQLQQEHLGKSSAQSNLCDGSPTDMQTPQYSSTATKNNPANVVAQEAGNWLSGSMDGGNDWREEDNGRRSRQDTQGRTSSRASVEQEEKKRKLANLLFACIDIAVCATLGVSALVLLPVDLTQAGGIVFGLSAVSFLTIRLFMNRTCRKQMKNHWAEGDEAADREEEALVRALRSQLYREDEQARTVARFLDEPAQQRTRCLFLDEGEADTEVQLVLKSRNDAGQEDIRISQAGGVIGKDILRADYLLNLPQISRVHARLEKKNEQWYLTDLNSRNGTVLQGKKLAPMQETVIEDGDAITFADIAFTVQIIEKDGI